MKQTVESFYHFVPPGWHSLLDKYLPQIWALAPDADFIINKTGGGLWICAVNVKNDAPFDDLTAIALAANQESKTVCQLCGKPGHLHTDTGRKETLCDHCAALRRSEKTVSEDIMTGPNQVEQAGTEEFVIIPTERLAETAALLQKKDAGLLLELPCPMGTPVWLIVTRQFRRTGNQFSFIRRSKLQGSNIERCCNEIGKTVFLTEAEAQAALTEIQKEAETDGP